MDERYPFLASLETCRADLDEDFVHSFPTPKYVGVAGTVNPAPTKRGKSDADTAALVMMPRNAIKFGLCSRTIPTSVSSFWPAFTYK